jgi:hypothetical protein
MYLLFLDESGAHAASPVFILAGLAVHENDVWCLQNRLDRVLLDNLSPVGVNHLDFELHATEIKSPNRRRVPRGGTRRIKAPVVSPWAAVPSAVRSSVLRDTYQALSSYRPVNSLFPVALFGAVVDAVYGDRAKRAYDLVFNKFDEMLDRQYRERGGERQRGLIIHDEHQIERDLQDWTTDWRYIGSRIGKLNNVVHVPLFTDSRSSRLLQAADFVAFALWRNYGVKDERWLTDLLPGFDHVDTALHGLIHVWPGFGRLPCSCPPCHERAGRLAT